MVLKRKRTASPIKEEISRQVANMPAIKVKFEKIKYYMDRDLGVIQPEKLVACLNEFDQKYESVKKGEFDEIKTVKTSPTGRGLVQQVKGAAKYLESKGKVI